MAQSSVTPEFQLFEGKTDWLKIQSKGSQNWIERPAIQADGDNGALLMMGVDVSLALASLYWGNHLL